jgi:phosphoribosylanthranilate isomerase
MVRVKVCGITRVEDALEAVAAGADALGFVFAQSPRRITPETVRKIVDQLPPFVTTVGVFVDEEETVIRKTRAYCGLHMVQLHGEEPESMARSLGPGVIKALRVGTGSVVDADCYPTSTLLLDTMCPGSAGGTGVTFDWKLAVEPAATRPVVLAGGLTPQNVEQAVLEVGPYAVDVSSGVESEPGRKDPQKLAKFVRRAKWTARGSYGGVIRCAQ